MIRFFFAFIFITNQVSALELKGTFEQGSLIIGKTNPSNEIYVDQKKLKEIEKNINEINQIKDTFVHVDENFKNYTIYIVTKLNLATAIKKIKDKLEHYKFTENIIKINDIKRDQRGKISKNFVKKLIR